MVEVQYNANRPKAEGIETANSVDYVVNSTSAVNNAPLDQQVQRCQLRKEAQRLLILKEKVEDQLS